MASRSGWLVGFPTSHKTRALGLALQQDTSQLAKDQSLIIVGLKHSGKSGVAQLLASNLGRPHYDADDLLEDYYLAEHQSQNTQNQLGFREIYAKLGKEGFDKLQISVLSQFLEKLPDSYGLSQAAPVLSLGGGAGDLEEIGRLLCGKNCLVVLLEEELELLFERILSGGLPPFLQDAPNLQEAFAKFCRISEPRLRRYRDWANMTIHCCGRSQQQVAKELCQRLLLKTCS